MDCVCLMKRRKISPGRMQLRKASNIKILASFLFVVLIFTYISKEVNQACIFDFLLFFVLRVAACLLLLLCMADGLFASVYVKKKFERCLLELQVSQDIFFKN